MLPLFLQINAATCAASLEWLEGRRGMNDYSDEFHDHVATVLAEAEKVVVAAERLYVSVSIRPQTIKGLHYLQAFYRNS